MPELPEVETIMRGLAPKIEKSKICKISLKRTKLRKEIPASLQKIAENSQIIGLRRRAKYLLCDIKTSPLDAKKPEYYTILFHLGMSGRILLEEISPEEKSPEKHEHVIFFLEGIKKEKIRLSYRDPRRFGMIDLYKTKEENLYPSFRNMGIEPLSQELNLVYLVQNLQKSKTNLKNFLLSQKYIVGLGNIYVCEILYKAGIHPARLTSSITEEECQKLLYFIPEILKAALRAGGSSLRDYVHSDGTKGGFQELHQVYGREGEACPDCETGTCPGIKRIIQGGRSSFFCPEKQQI